MSQALELVLLVAILQDLLHGPIIIPGHVLAVLVY